VRVAVGVLAEEAEPVVPAGFQVGRAITGEPLPCLCLCLEEALGDCCRAVVADEPPVECVGVRDLGQQFPEGTLRPPALPSAVSCADPFMREDTDDWQAADPAAGAQSRQAWACQGGRDGLGAAGWLVSATVCRMGRACRSVMAAVVMRSWQDDGGAGGCSAVPRRPGRGRWRLALPG
jgi:hypothetical protein